MGSGPLSNAITGGWPQVLVAIWEGILTRDKQKEYDAAVEAQIAEGRDGLQARSDTALRMLQEDPSSRRAQRVMAQLRQTLPREAFKEVDETVRLGKKRRTEFLSDYDQRTGSYLDEAGQAQGALMDRLTGENADTAAGYRQREADVLGLLEGQGNAALADTDRSFGEQTGAAMGDLAARGLSGSTVGSSIRGGLATRKSEQQARIREDVARLRAQTLAQLRGDTLGFGERATQLGAGFMESGINRGLGARADVESARAQFDSAMSGDTADRRERALDRAYGLRRDLDTQYANFQQDRADQRLQTYQDTSRDYFDFVNNVNNVPPDRSGFNQLAYAAGQGVAK